MKSCINLPPEKKQAWQVLCAAEKISLSQLIIAALDIVVSSEKLLKKAIKQAVKK